MLRFLSDVPVRVLAVLFTMLFLSGCAMLPEEPERLPPPLIQPAEPTYEIYTVLRKDISLSVNATGNLVAASAQTLFFEQQGIRFEEFLIGPGDTVGAGDLLATGESEAIKQQIKLLELDLEKLEIELQFLRETLTETEVGNTENSHEVRRTRKDIRIKDIDIKRTRIILDNLNQQLADMQIKSPINGVVTYLADLRQGDIVEAYKPLIVVSNPENLLIHYQGASVAPVKMGMEARVLFDRNEYSGIVVMAPDTPLTGQEAINRDIIKVEAENLPSDAQLGDSIGFEIILQHKRDVLVIPRRAVQRFMGETTVLVMDGDTKRELNVEVGIETSTEAEITSGLQEGQSVIVH